MFNDSDRDMCGFTMKRFSDWLILRSKWNFYVILFDIKVAAELSQPLHMRATSADRAKESNQIAHFGETSANPAEVSNQVTYMGGTLENPAKEGKQITHTGEI